MPDAPLDAVPPRTRILNAASTIFSEQGYQGGSLNDVAVRAGLTRPGLLHYFPSKHALLLALLDERDRELSRSSPRDGATLTMLLDYIETAIGQIAGNRELVQLAHILTAEAGGPDHPAHKWVAARHEYFRCSFGAAAQLSIDAGDLPSDTDPLLFGTLLLGIIEGVENQWLIDPLRVDMLGTFRVMRATMGL